LIIAKPGGLRDGLTALISVVPFVHQIYHEVSYADALRRIRHSRPVLVILDGDLYGASGLDFLRLLKGQYSDVLCLVLVEDARQADLAKDAGADDVLIKGIHADQLLAAIEKHLFRRRN
jgi:DNA-binding response OmpR family regulator